MHEREEKCIVLLSKNFTERDHLKDLGVDGQILT
jgi:hypothetical protein